MKRITITALALALLCLCGCGRAAAQTSADTFAGVSDLPHNIDASIRCVGQLEADEPADAVEQEYAEYWEETYCDDGCYELVYYGGNDYGNSFKANGEAYDENYSYTWYSQNVLDGSGLTELNENGRHVDESTGFIVDGDGYIAVAMNGVEQGTVIETIWGDAKVYDVKQDGAPYDGTVDVYTDF